jgi:CubicO group peptidase (beta-lactamase class C family)
MHPVAFTVAGKVVEQVSGVKFIDFVRAHIFEPLGLDSATYDPLKDAPEKLVQGRRARPDIATIDVAFHLKPSADKNQFGPCSGVVMSTRDLCTWMNWFISTVRAHACFYVFF